MTHISGMCFFVTRQLSSVTQRNWCGGYLRVYVPPVGCRGNCLCESVTDDARWPALTDTLAASGELSVCITVPSADKGEPTSLGVGGGAVVFPDNTHQHPWPPNLMQRLCCPGSNYTQKIEIFTRLKKRLYLYVWLFADMWLFPVVQQDNVFSQSLSCHIYNVAGFGRII